MKSPMIPTFVYAIGAMDYVKIGVATDPRQRLERLQTANPYKLELLDTREFPSREKAYQVEAFIHAELDEQNQRSSGEWFHRKPSDPLMWLDFYHGQHLKVQADLDAHHAAVMAHPVYAALADAMSDVMLDRIISKRRKFGVPT